MRHRRYIVGLLGFCVLAVRPAATAAQTPASVALLVNQLTDAQTPTQLTAALADARPETRLVAARVAFVGHVGGPVLPALLEALDREQDPRAGLEEIRAAIDLAGTAIAPAADARIVTAVKRFGSPAARLYLVALARTRPADVVARLPELAPIYTRPASAGAALAAAVVRDQTLTERALAVLAASPDDDRRDLVPAFFDALDFVDPDTVSIVTRALQSTSDRVRRGAIWQAARLMARGEAVHGAILGLIAATPADADSEDAFAHDILGRLLAKPSAPSPRWPAILRQHPWRIPKALRSVLTKDEFEALKPTFDEKDKTQPAREKPHPVRYAPPETPRLRSLADVSAGLIDDLLSRAGCTSRNVLDKAAAEIHYAASGRPTRVAVAADHPAPACDLALRAAASLSIARQDELWPEKAVDTVILSIAPSRACAQASPLAPTAEPMSDDETIVKPVVRHEQKPDFPAGARARGVEGTPWVHVLVTSKGCVADMDIDRRADAELDLAALAAVSRWRFDPAQRGGQAIAVDVVIEVSFTLEH